MGPQPCQILLAHNVKLRDYLPGHIYFPLTQWKELVKKYPDLGHESVFRVVTRQTTFLLYPLPTPHAFMTMTIIVPGFLIDTPALDLPSNMYRLEEFFAHTKETPEIAIESTILNTGHIASLLYGLPLCPGFTLKTIIQEGEEVTVHITGIRSRPTEERGPWRTSIKTRLYTSFAKSSSKPLMPVVSLGNLDTLLEEMTRNAVHATFQIPFPRGILLHGPPGAGKTYLVQSFCHNFGIFLTIVNGEELVSRAEDLEDMVRDLRQAFSNAQRAFPSVLLLDKVEMLAPTREQLEDYNRGWKLTELFRQLDQADPRLVIVGATSRPMDVDLALKMAGRLERECVIHPPDEPTRLRLLECMLKELACQYQFGDSQVSLEIMARRTVGFVPADLRRFVEELLIAALYNHQTKKTQNADDSTAFIIDEKILNQTLLQVTPSIAREFRVPFERGLTWDDLGGLQTVRQQLQRAVEWPLTRSKEYQHYGLIPPRGILLYGPPGCSKTTIAKILANSGNFNFYSLNGAAVFSAYVGEAERLVREVFRCARLTAPSLLFFDELDALVGKRGSSSTDAVQERVLATFLNEMDGIESAGHGVVVLGATNRREAIDEALLRPGRFDLLVKVPLPNESERQVILRVIGKKMPIDENVDYHELSRRMEGASGAELYELLREAAMMAIRNRTSTITMTHLLQVLDKKELYS